MKRKSSKLNKKTIKNKFLGSTVAEHSSHDPETVGSNPATGTGRRGIAISLGDVKTHTKMRRVNGSPVRPSFFRR